MTGKVMLICSACSMRVRGMNREDVPERGIVCRCGHRMLPGTIKDDPGRRRPTPLPECPLRGEQVSQVDCKCQGKVRVFACSHPQNSDGLAVSHRPAALQGKTEAILPNCRQCPFTQETAKPRLLQMGQSATSAAIGFLTSGGKILGRDERGARLATCNGCSSLKGPQCIECGCLVAIKTWLPKERCPLDKWPKLKE